MSKEEKKHENPPAFPIAASCSPAGDYLHPDSWGMTLRDFFAAHALQGIISSGHEEAIEKLTKLAEGNTSKGVALAAYGFADAMLKVRSL